ncbi:UDP-N-acetylmuramate--L-alanine ligase [Leptospira langatensis]|uniref:UDP-N-acetylmuramate--L-alanine ligase n=1 Tax=Leptospira langatensis TaxID=2484983 RepID=A0A5F1ZTR2_9LEPT|nr:UDP-N-acetylmuramate--L-alanine ligase [Leptospira langatensis]TGJ98877.1 UDP-N-acetylmuramate--L-alanine ligase [Leptospira langatensis]TGL40556.1 UDP-N-acetylmuramate--L-alanine ligase [Leptospira langatensis]
MSEASLEKALGFTKPFFLGIGGSGMSSLAHILSDAGLSVTGYDGKKSPVTEALEKKGVRIFSSLAEIPDEDYDAAIYSSAIRLDSHPIASHFKKKGIRFYHRSEVLHSCFRHLTCIAVAGSHGKTTTTAMTAHILNDLGYSPSLMVGGDVAFLGGIGGRFSTGKFGVFESDESDGTFLNHKSEFRILTNIDEDHLDFYKTREKLLAAFAEFISSTPEQIVLDLDNVGIQDCLVQIQDHTRILGFVQVQEKDWDTMQIAKDRKYSDLAKLVYYKIENKHLVFRMDGEEFTLTSRFPGKHYLTNSLAAVLAAFSVGVPIASAARSVSDYAGVKRRLEYIGTKNGVQIYDDYGHHPTEVKAVLSSVKELSQGSGKAVILFQPHRFTRTQNLYKDFAESLDLGETVLLLPIYSAGEDPISGVSSELIANEMKKKPKLLSGNLRSDLYLLNEILSPGDVFVSLGAGNVREWGLGFLNS